MQVSDALTGTINLPSAGLEVGDMELISTITLNTTATEVNFIGIPQTYKNLEIYASFLMSSLNADMQIQYNGSSSSYTWMQVYSNGSSGGAGANSGMSFTYLASNAGNSSQPYVAVASIPNYTSSKIKVHRVLGGGDQNGGGTIKQEGGIWTGTNPITSIRLYAGGGTINAYSVFSLYGVRG